MGEVAGVKGEEAQAVMAAAVATAVMVAAAVMADTAVVAAAAGAEEAAVVVANATPIADPTLNRDRFPTMANRSRKTASRFPSSPAAAFLKCTPTDTAFSAPH